MRPKTLFLGLLQTLSDFRSARGGNVAVMFALASVPIICMVGATIDYSRANDVKVKMQSAVDSAALLLSKEAPTDTESQLETNASSYFFALFNAQDAQNITVTPQYSSSNGTSITVNAAADVPTTLLVLLGIKSVKVGTSSTAKWGSVKLRVALVLDNTGSMQQSGKMDALKIAAKNFLSQLQSGATNDGDIYVSIIPFSTSVNVGSTNYNQSWLDWRDFGSCSGGGWGSSNNYTWALCKAAHNSGRHTRLPKEAPGPAASPIAAARMVRPGKITTPTSTRQPAALHRSTPPWIIPLARRRRWG